MAQKTISIKGNKLFHIALPNDSREFSKAIFRKTGSGPWVLEELNPCYNYVGEAKLAKGKEFLDSLPQEREDV